MPSSVSGGDDQQSPDDVRRLQPRLRPLRTSAIVEPADAAAFLEALYAAGVSRSTYELFRALVALPAAERLRLAAVMSVNICYGNPEAANPVQQALDIEAYTSYCEVQRLDIPVAVKTVADRLLCMNERAALLVFFRPAFRWLREAETHRPQRTP